MMLKVIAISAKVALWGMIFILTLDLCARIDDWFKWEAPFWAPYSEMSLGVVDSLGFHNRPNARYQKWRINSFGFRGDNITLEKPAGTIRVMVLGASETFGLYESPGMDYPAQLARFLNEQIPHQVEVLNAAAPGMSPPRIVQYYRAYLRQFEPDVVVYYPSPIFYLSIQPPEYERVSVPPTQKASAFAWRLPGKASIVIKRFLPDDMQTRIKKYLIDRAERNHHPDWLFREVPAGRDTLFRHHLADLLDQVRQGGAYFLTATHATVITDTISPEDRNLLIGWRKLYPHVTEQVFLQNELAVNRVVRGYRDSLGASVLDFDQLAPKSPDFFADHVHFTDRGAELLAKSIASAIIEILSSGQRPIQNRASPGF